MATRKFSSIVLGVVCVLLPQSGIAQISGDTLPLSEVHARIEASNPMVGAAAARVAAVGAMEGSTGLPPDPQLRLGVMNASLPGLQTDMPTSMAPSIELMQMLPLPGKLGLTREIARAETQIARAEAEGIRWMARSAGGMAYYEIFSIDRQTATMRETLRLLQDLEAVARAMYASGEGRQADVLRASVEIGRMEAEIGRMTAMRSAAVARLNALMNRSADTPIRAVADPPDDVVVPSPETLREWAEASSPALTAGALATSRAATRTSLARRELWPDLTLGIQYGQRPGDMGTERMGSVMVGFSVPVFATRRQLQMREEASAMSRMAEAELSGARADVHARITELLAEIDRARTLLALYTTEIQPQASAAVESAYSSYRVGGVDFMTLVDARMTVATYEGQVHVLRAEFAQALAELEAVVGRELPRAVQTEEEG